ncbi:hypothetical protein M3J09_000196 [Ascochyta lentis]
MIGEQQRTTTIKYREFCKQLPRSRYLHWAKNAGHQLPFRNLPGSYQGGRVKQPHESDPTPPTSAEHFVAGVSIILIGLRMSPKARETRRP